MDFLDDEALLCERDITVNSANTKYLAACHQPVKGRYFTIQNYANIEFDEYAQSYHGEEQCMNICEVDIYMKGNV